MKFREKLIIILFTVLAFPFISEAYGHGVGFETLPPVKVGDKEVAMEVQSSQYENPENPDRRISFSLFDSETGITLRDVTYHIKAEKGGQFLFEDTFATCLLYTSPSPRDS